MSLLSELCKKKSALKSTNTVITYVDGKRFIESKQNDILKIDNLQYGFVVDEKPDNIPAKVLSNLYLGSQDCCEEAVLQNYSITHVLSVGVEPIYKYDYVTYKFVQCLDLPETNITAILINNCIPFIKDCIQNNGTVLVHCNAGVSRSSTIVIGFLMMEEKVSYEEVFTKIKSVRSCIKPNIGFEKQLKSLYM